MSDERLSRMEDKLDKPSEAVYAIARMEERMLSVFKRLENIDGSINRWTVVWTRLKSKPDQRPEDCFRRTPVLDGHHRRRWFSFHVVEIVD